MALWIVTYPQKHSIGQNKNPVWKMAFDYIALKIGVLII